MERIFHCYQCRTELGITELHYLPGQEIYDHISGIRYNSGENYCGNCYDELTKPAIKVDSTIKDTTLIKDLEINPPNINLLVNVTKKISEKLVEKDGEKLRLGTFLVNDKSGEITLILWNKVIDLINEGDSLYLKNIYVRKWNDENRITLGQNGTISKIDNS